MLSPAAFVDRLAADVPHNLWVRTSPKEQGLDWEDVTYLQLSRAVNAMSHWIERELGAGTGDEPVAYAGVNDVRYPIIILAALKTGYKSLLISSRNSREGNLSLLGATGCTKVLFGAELGRQFNDLAVASSELKVVQVPDVHELLADKDAPGYETSRSEQMEDQETVLIVHSSGTTGHPKPVYIKAGVFRVAAKITTMPAPEGRQNLHTLTYGTKLVLATIPFCHIFGIMLIVRSIYYQNPLHLLSPDKPPTAELLLDAIDTAHPTIMATTPSLLEDICNLPAGLPTLSKLDAVLYGGAPLARSCGDSITAVTTLLNGIGSTEAFNLANLVPADPADWDYFEWNPHAGIVMEPTGEDPSLAELVIQRLPEGEGNYQCVFHNFPEVTEWRTKDLFERHPDPGKSGLWKYVGRADDMIVLSNGEKVNPVAFEKAVEGHPWVKGALVVGAGQFQTGLIIEPHAEQANVGKEAFMEEVWPWVEQANARSPAHARVWRSMVVLAAVDKPFKRTAKGSVMRQATYRLYEEEIKALYGGQAALTNGFAGGAGLGGTSVRDVVRKAVRSVLGARAQNTADSTNLVSLGVDSLQVLQLCQVLGSSGIRCATRTVYENPTVSLLTEAVSGGSNDKCACNTISREERMSAMIHRYTNFARKRKPKPPGRCVLLVGSTGALGTHLLHELMESPEVDRVYCLNRSSNAAERQAQAFLDRGLGTVDFLAHPKVLFFQGETYLENFGLSAHDYAGVHHSVDLVLLNAWPVNFNSSLESFEQVISGVQRCANFSASSRHRPHIAFVSSVASSLNFPAIRRRDDDDDDVLLIPEKFEPDNSLPARQGYGESKHVASVILAKAVKELSIGATVLRVGQLAGTANGKGVWNKQEWVPTLIKTSKSLGKIPQSLGPAYDGIIWVPVDVAAKTILELVPKRIDLMPTSQEGLECFNVVNPRFTTWSDLVSVLQRHYAEQGQGKVKAVGFDEWLDDLRGMATSASADDIDRYPALKLLDFFEEMRGDEGNGQWGFATARGVERSPAMAALGAVDAKLMQKWLHEWQF